MGLTTTMIIEQRQSSGKWVAQYDMLRPEKKTDPNERIGISFHTMLHNCLLEAHLLGCFDVMDPGNAPEHLHSKFRIGQSSFRGLPRDVSDETVAAMINKPGKPASWVTIEEIMAFDWTQPLKHHLWINGPDLLHWMQEDSSLTLRPPRADYYYHTAPNGTESDAEWREVVPLSALQGVVYAALLQARRRPGSLSRKELLEREEHLVEQASARRYAQVQRTLPLFEACDGFLGKVVPQMLRGDPKSMRLIAWVT